MFDAPVDAWYLWLGVAAASLTALGAAVGLPSAPPPDAAAAAGTVDSVAASPYAAIAEHPLAADELRLGPRSIALRGDGGVARARFAYGPVVPVRDGPLGVVLDGRPPREAFQSREAFERAVEGARDRDPVWRPAPDSLQVRRISWGEEGVTLVG